MVLNFLRRVCVRLRLNRLWKPDLDAADRALQAELAKVPEDQFEVIEMGETFADRIDVTCAPLP